MNLPSGWTVRRYSTWHHRRLTSRSTVYRFERDDLEVRRKDGKHWVLLHQGKDTGNRFTTAKDAIEHADDARIHGH